MVIKKYNKKLLKNEVAIEYNYIFLGREEGCTVIKGKYKEALNNGTTTLYYIFLLKPITTIENNLNQQSTSPVAFLTLAQVHTKYTSKFRRNPKINYFKRALITKIAFLA